MTGRLYVQNPGPYSQCRPPGADGRTASSSTRQESNTSCLAVRPAAPLIEGPISKIWHGFTNTHLKVSWNARPAIGLPSAPGTPDSTNLSFLDDQRYRDKCTVRVIHTTPSLRQHAVAVSAANWKEDIGT